MFEFRGARESERNRAERGSASGVSRGQRAYEAAMAANAADRTANTLAAQQSISNIQRTEADMAMREEQRQEIARQRDRACGGSGTEAALALPSSFAHKKLRWAALCLVRLADPSDACSARPPDRSGSRRGFSDAGRRYRRLLHIRAC